MKDSPHYKKWIEDNADNNWDLPDIPKNEWVAVGATNGYQKFYERCLGSSTRPKFGTTFPYKLSLGVWPDNTDLLPFYRDATSGGQILVIESYHKLLDRILSYREHRGKGVLLTGQPGTGKTTFLKFMLALLLSAGQVVVLCNRTHVYFFCHGQAYVRPIALGFLGLPTHKQHRTRAVWALIDMDFGSQEPPISGDLEVWPIQASSPNPAQWGKWRKQLRAAMWGMPLWDMDELMEGLPFVPGYHELRSKLERFLPLLGGSAPPKSGDEPLDALLEVLYQERERERVAAVTAAEVAAEEAGMEAEENRGKADHDTETQFQGKNPVDKADQPQAQVYKVEEALRILVRNATEEFGFIPRDVYLGVTDLPDIKMEHNTASKNPDYSQLKSLTSTFATRRKLGPASHKVIVVYPHKFSDRNDGWDIDFKSIRIAASAVEAMRLKGDQHIQDMYDELHKNPEGSLLAGRTFEAIAHRVFSDGSPLQCIPMISNKANPPMFSTPDNPSSLSSTPLTCPGGRVVTRVDFNKELGNVTLDSDKYYIPAAADNPLFDSFVIDPESRPVVISVFQIAISSRYGGSAKGYFNVRQIKARVRGLFKASSTRRPPNIIVKYFLVSPQDGDVRQWEMPTGWGETTKNHHRGDVFHIAIPSR